MADKIYSPDSNRNFLHLGAIDKGIAGVDVSAAIGTAPDRMTGILGKPLAKGGVPTSARMSINSSAEKVTPPVRAKLSEMGASTVNVRNMISRKR